ncbi:MAG: zinc-ribbon domain-containing protein [Candidatus Krumholzibacteriota bacterium]|nr:zinc-ribbon domain-containing protein [Candidatus Krumholzibacteriota bacterium]
MIVTCDGCQTKYLLGDDKVPGNGIRVRCPKCRHVWRLVPPPADPVFEVAGGAFAAEAPVAEPARGGWASMDRTPASAPAMDTAPAHEEIEMPAAEPQAPPPDPELRRRDDRARRQARVFVSDILEYNREKRDRALENGDLMSALGTEIKKAWEAYKDKVGPDCVEANTYFRDALNTILADGQSVF